MLLAGSEVLYQEDGLWGWQTEFDQDLKGPEEDDHVVKGRIAVQPEGLKAGNCEMMANECVFLVTLKFEHCH